MMKQIALLPGLFLHLPALFFGLAQRLDQFLGAHAQRAQAQNHMLLHPIAGSHTHRAPLMAEQRALSFYILIRRLLRLGIYHPHTAYHGFAALIIFYMVPVVYQYDLYIGKAGKIRQLIG